MCVRERREREREWEGGRLPKETQDPPTPSPANITTGAYGIVADFCSAALAFLARMAGSVSSLNVVTNAAGHQDATSGVTILGTGSRVRLSLPEADWILCTAIAAVGT